MFSWLYTLLISWYLSLVVHFVGILVCFLGCELGSDQGNRPRYQQHVHFVGTLCWYLGMFSWLYTLLVSWYLSLVVHFVDILVCFLGCELGSDQGNRPRYQQHVHFVGTLVCFPGCTLCWYLGTVLVIASLHFCDSSLVSAPLRNQTLPKL